MNRRAAAPSRPGRRHSSETSTAYADKWTGLTKLLYSTLLRPFQSTPEQAARSTVALASDPALAGKTGLCMTPPARVEAAGQRLLTLSRQRIGL